MIILLRWLGVVPAAIVGWLLAFALGLDLLGFVDSLCPPELVVSGMCNAPWYPLAERSVMCVGAGLAAFFVVGLSSFVAPSHRIAVSWISFGVGALFAIYGTISTSAIVELASALGAGLLAVFVVRWVVTSGRSPSRALRLLFWLALVGAGAYFVAFYGPFVFHYRPA